MTSAADQGEPSHWVHLVGCGIAVALSHHTVRRNNVELFFNQIWEPNE